MGYSVKLQCHTTSRRRPKTGRPIFGVFSARLEGIVRPEAIAVDREATGRLHERDEGSTGGDREHMAYGTLSPLGSSSCRMARGGEDTIL